MHNEMLRKVPAEQPVKDVLKIDFECDLEGQILIN